MVKTFTDLSRHALNGATMGTRWSALFHAEPGFDIAPLQHEIGAVLNAIDEEMSTWRPDSALMRLNAAPCDVWLEVSPAMLTVLGTALAVGQLSNGAFDIGMGASTRAWGFGPAPASAEAIAGALAAPHRPAHMVLELDEAGSRVKKHAPLDLDLSAIAKGYGADRMAQILTAHGIENGLTGLDGELYALGTQPDGRPWTIAVEAPDDNARKAHSLIEVQDAGVATSGDYRHFVMLQGKRLAHTMDPRRGGPLEDAPASVSVVARSAMEADAFATAIMVLGRAEGAAFAARLGLNALILTREDGSFASTGVGRLFAT